MTAVSPCAGKSGGLFPSPDRLAPGMGRTVEAARHCAHGTATGSKAATKTRRTREAPGSRGWPEKTAARMRTRGSVTTARRDGRSDRLTRSAPRRSPGRPRSRVCGRGINRAICVTPRRSSHRLIGGELARLPGPVPTTCERVGAAAVLGHGRTTPTRRPQRLVSGGTSSLPGPVPSRSDGACPASVASHGCTSPA